MVISNNQGYTLKEAAKSLGVSELTIRRYIKSGKLVGNKVSGKFGEHYIIDSLPSELMDKAQPVEKTVSYTNLIARLEQLNQEVGYWKGKAQELERQVLLLEAPKQNKKWWQRLFS